MDLYGKRLYKAIPRNPQLPMGPLWCQAPLLWGCPIQPAPVRQAWRRLYGLIYRFWAFSRAFLAFVGNVGFWGLFRPFSGFLGPYVL